MNNKNRHLSIIAHLPHYFNNDSYFAYEPYVREIELWASIFEEVTIYTEKTNRKPSWALKQLPQNCSIKSIYLKSGPGLKNNFIRLLQLPVATIQVIWIMFNSELLHLRSPGATTIIANFFNRLFNKRCIVKWATFFGEMPIKNKILKWERRLLLTPPENTRVLVYGSGTHPNHVPFFPAMFSKVELDKINESKIPKTWEAPFQLICVGRMYRYKSFDLALSGLAKFKKKYPEIKWRLTFVGDGEERPKLVEIVKNGGIEEEVEFVGSKPFDKTIEYYQKAHVSIMPGMFEGWPKVVNEAWALGCIPFVVNVGNATYPIKFSNGGGHIFDPEPESFADSLAELLSKPAIELEKISEKGHSINYEMTLEKFQEGIEKVLKTL